jgi:hypothetical protein
MYHGTLLLVAGVISADHSSIEHLTSFYDNLPSPSHCGRVMELKMMNFGSYCFYSMAAVALNKIVDT